MLPYFYSCPLNAIFVIASDTFHSMCGRRLFWLNIWLALASVAAFASLKCTDLGLSIGFGLREYPSAFLRAGTDWETTMIMGVVSRILRWQVMTAAPLLAVFSLAAVMPATLHSGFAALVFPKAGWRGKVLLGRFLGGMMFAAVPAVLCSAGLCLVLGWRCGIWEPRVLLAVPFALLMFSFLGAVVLTLGVLTRSASAALLGTLFFAGTVWTLQEAASHRVSAPAGPPVPASASAVAKPADDGSEAVRWLAAALPRTEELSRGLDQALRLTPPRRFRELVRRWSVGGVSVGVAATEVLAPEDPAEAPPEELNLMESILVTCGFACFVLFGGNLLLSRRDL